MKNKSLVRRTILAMTVWSCMTCATFTANGQSRSFGSTFSPAATDNSEFVLGANLSREQSFKVMDNIFEKLLKMPDVDKRSIDEARQMANAYKRDPWANAPQDVRDFLKECGLLDVYPRWGVLSLEGPLQIDADTPDLNGMALAIAVDANLGKVISALRKKMAESNENDVSFQEITVGGEKAWHIISNDRSFAKEMKGMNADPHLASLDGKLLLLAMSRRTLEKQIRLYRKGREGGDALRGFSAKDGELLRIHVSGIGDMIKKSKSLDAMHDTMPNDFVEAIASIGEEIITGLQTLSADIKVAQNGTIGLTTRLEAASEDDAELIRTLVGAALSVAKIFAAKSPDAPKETVAMLKSLHIGGTGNKIEFRCTDVFPILAGSLLPAITSAKGSATSTSMAMKGRTLFIGIVQTNTEREASGLAAVWPHTGTGNAASADDIAEKTYTRSTDFFRDLFDMSNHGRAEWDPYVNCDIDVAGKNLDDWCVAANVTAEMPDCIPVLISANFNPKLLPSKWDGISDDSVRLPIGPASGAAKSLLDDKAIVVVRKGGAAQVIKAKDLTYETLYGGQAFDLTDAKTPVVYLTPKGIARPATRK